MTVASYYTPLGPGRFQPSEHVRGAWNDHEQHMAPVSGLVAHALETHEPRAQMQLARISYDILGLIPAEPTEVDVRTLRPGRTIELLEATVVSGGRPVVRARAWRLAHYDTAAVCGGDAAPMPDPQSLPPWDGPRTWPGGYIASLEGRAAPDNVPGCGRVWLRTDVTLVAGVKVSPTAAFVGLVDTANGVVVRESPDGWMFPNVDLSIHLFRQPVAGWVGLDTTVTFGATGVGLTSSTLHDSRGPVGRSEQLLTLRPRPARHTSA